MHNEPHQWSVISIKKYHCMDHSRWSFDIVILWEPKSVLAIVDGAEESPDDVTEH